MQGLNTGDNLRAHRRKSGIPSRPSQPSSWLEYSCPWIFLDNPQDIYEGLTVQNRRRGPYGSLPAVDTTDGLTPTNADEVFLNNATNEFEIKSANLQHEYPQRRPRPDTGRGVIFYQNISEYPGFSLTDYSKYYLYKDLKISSETIQKMIARYEDVWTDAFSNPVPDGGTGYIVPSGVAPTDSFRDQAAQKFNDREINNTVQSGKGRAIDGFGTESYISINNLNGNDFISSAKIIRNCPFTSLGFEPGGTGTGTFSTSSTPPEYSFYVNGEFKSHTPTYLVSDGTPGSNSRWADFYINGHILGWNVYKNVKNRYDIEEVVTPPRNFTTISEAFQNVSVNDGLDDDINTVTGQMSQYPVPYKLLKNNEKWIIRNKIPLYVPPQLHSNYTSDANKIPYSSQKTDAYWESLLSDRQELVIDVIDPQHNYTPVEYHGAYRPSPILYVDNTNDINNTNIQSIDDSNQMESYTQTVGTDVVPLFKSCTTNENPFLLRSGLQSLFEANEDTAEYRKKYCDFIAAAGDTIVDEDRSAQGGPATPSVTRRVHVNKIMPRGTNGEPHELELPMKGIGPADNPFMDVKVGTSAASAAATPELDQSGTNLIYTSEVIPGEAAFKDWSPSPPTMEAYWHPRYVGPITTADQREKSRTMDITVARYAEPMGQGPGQFRVVGQEPDILAGSRGAWVHLTEPITYRIPNSLSIPPVPAVIDPVTNEVTPGPEEDFVSPYVEGQRFIFPVFSGGGPANIRDMSQAKIDALSASYSYSALRNQHQQSKRYARLTLRRGRNAGTDTQTVFDADGFPRTVLPTDTGEGNFWGQSVASNKVLPGYYDDLSNLLNRDPDSLPQTEQFDLPNAPGQERTIYSEPTFRYYDDEDPDSPHRTTEGPPTFSTTSYSYGLSATCLKNTPVREDWSFKYNDAVDANLAARGGLSGTENSKYQELYADWRTNRKVAAAGYGINGYLDYLFGPTPPAINRTQIPLSRGRRGLAGPPREDGSVPTITDYENATNDRVNIY